MPARPIPEAPPPDTPARPGPRPYVGSSHEPRRAPTGPRCRRDRHHRSLDNHRNLHRARRPDHARRRRGPEGCEPDALGPARGVRPPTRPRRNHPLRISGRTATTSTRRRVGVCPAKRGPDPDSDPSPTTRPSRSRTRPTGNRSISRPVRVPTVSHRSPRTDPTAPQTGSRRPTSRPPWLPSAPSVHSRTVAISVKREPATRAVAAGHGTGQVDLDRLTLSAPCHLPRPTTRQRRRAIVSDAHIFSPPHN